MISWQSVRSGWSALAYVEVVSECPMEKEQLGPDGDQAVVLTDVVWGMEKGVHCV